MQAASIGNKKEKIIEYDILRVLATIFVVIGHSTYYSIQDTFGQIDFQILEYISFKSEVIYTVISEFGGWIYSFHMPLFFFLSGAVFAIKNINSITFDYLLKTKFIRLIIPYILVLTLFVIPIKTIASFYSVSDLANVYMYGLHNSGTTGGHLWFLISLFWCFVFFYPIAKYLKDRYFTILLICFLLANISNMMPSLDIVLWSNPFTYIFWFSLGYILHQYREKINNLVDKGMLFVLSLASSKFLFLDSFLQILVSILFIYGLCYYLSQIRWFHENKCYQLLSKNTFEIYLFHDPLNYLLLYGVYTLGLHRLFSAWYVALVCDKNIW